MMELLLAVFMALSIGQTQAFPTAGNNVEITFSEDSNVSPSNGANRNNIDFWEQNEAQNIEEALFTYTQLLKGMNEKSGIQPFIEDLSNELAKEQTTDKCSEPACDCEKRKISNYNGTREDTGETCTLVSVPNCEGVCDSTHRYITLKLDTDVYIHVTPCTGMML